MLYVPFSGMESDLFVHPKSFEIFKHYFFYLFP